jgi:iron complex outermembrane receptor protein
VINIQTRSPAEDHGFYGRATVGDNGVADGFVRYGGKLGTIDYAVSLFSQGDHGYDGLVDDTRNTGVTVSAELPVNAGGSVKLMAGYSRGDYEIDNSESSLAGNAPEAQREKPAEDNFQTIQWRQNLDETTELTATLSHNRFYWGDKGFTNDRLIPGTTLRIRFDLEEERYGGDFKLSKIFSDQWRGVAGLGYQYERNQAPYYFATNDKLDNNLFRLYGHTEYRPSDQWVFNAGAMLERSDLSAKDWLFLPRLSAHYHLNDQHTFRAAFSTGSRQPTLYESRGRAIITADENPLLTIYRVYATGRENGGLDPERIQSFELGYQWFPSRSSYLDVRVFYERLSDLTVAFYRENSGLLTVLPNQTVLDFANEEDITIRGAEAQLDWRNASGLRLFASYALAEIDGDGTRYNNGYEDSTPRHSFGLLASQQLGNGWEASLLYDYQSDMQWYFDEAIDSYQKLDMRIAKRWRWDSHQAVAELILTNLLGPINDYLPDQEWERGVLFRFSIDL